MSAYVLIVMTYVYGGGQTLAVPFHTLQACQAARDDLRGIKVPLGSGPVRYAECYPTDHGRTRQ